VLDARPVRGFFRGLRTRVDALLIAILFLVPWLEFGGEPLLRLDIPHRRFHVFGLVIFPEELLFLWLIVIGLALALFFFTALAGRLWCGWGCPQTIFSDLFAGVARRIQGWRGTRAPVRPSRARVAATHLAWGAIALVIGFHVVSYFCSPRDLARELLHAEVSPTRLGFLAAASLLAYLDFGLVRQTFCKYLCPYARFQGVLFDAETLVVAYDPVRGEPRGKRGKVSGDCVDCGLCVAVCPTGIDIRNGLQLECIACTQCIDACDGVMAKLGRAPKLIGYRSQVELTSRRRARVLRPRVVVYGALLLAVVGGFVAAIAARVPFDVLIAHNAASLYATLADGRPANAYTLHVENRDRVAHRLELSLEAPDGFALVTGVNPIGLDPVSSRELRIFVAGPRAQETAHAEAISFSLADVDHPSLRLRRAATFLFEAREAPDHETREREEAEHDD
jgi:cytochrome c oxidase accessory protein FixG